MADDLLIEVQRGLQARRSQWATMAEQIECVSLSWIEKMGRGAYESEPSYRRLRAVAEWMAKNPAPVTEERAA